MEWAARCAKEAARRCTQAGTRAGELPLPFCGAHSPSLHRATRAIRRGNPMTKILLVEDNEMNRDMLSRRLARAGYKVFIAEDGARGVAMAMSASPDLILMDMSLPVLDGWEATRRIKATAELSKIPIIALTAHAMATDREKALKAGCDEYDTKPIELERLLGKIRALLEAADSNEC